MSGKHAKILSDHQLKCLLIFACNTRNPIRDKLIVLLSVKAGLRAGEIAKLTWDMVLDPTGEIGDVDRAARLRGQEEERSADPHQSEPCELLSRPGGR